MKILVDENIPYAQKLFSKLGEVEKINGRNINIRQLQQSDALIIRSTTKVNSTLLTGSKIKFIGTTTSGIDHIDYNWLVKEGIQFSAAPGCNAISVVEYIFSALLWLSQRDDFFLQDKTIGIIGVGNIGSCLQQRLKALDINVLLCDPPKAESGITGQWKSLEKLIAEADILTFHTPLIYDGSYPTWHQVNTEVLEALPDNRILINTSRGAIIDNNALLNTLKHGKKINLILDVWESEPKLPLTLLPYIDICTTHIAGYTIEARIRGVVQVFNAYSNFLNINKYVNLKSLLPSPLINSIKLCNCSINEDILRKLVHLIYDVRQDDIALRRNINYHNIFDQLRKNYFKRREWSSMYVDIDNDIEINKLKQLGFNTY